MGNPVYVYQGKRPRDVDSALDACEAALERNADALDAKGEPRRLTRRMRAFVDEIRSRWPADTEAQLLDSPWHDMPPWESAAGRLCEIELDLEHAPAMIPLLAQIAARHRLICVDAANGEAYLPSGQVLN